MKNISITIASTVSMFTLYIMPINGANNPEPYDFNVYTSGNIGTSSNAYGSDIEGEVGSGGNAYFSNFSGNASGPAYLYSVYTGGNFNLTSGSINNGGIEAGGNININSATIYGNVHGGGNLQGGNGTIEGNASLYGNNTSSLTIDGTVSTQQSFTPSLNLPSVTNYFQNASSYWGGLAPTATVNNVSGQLQVSNLLSGRNIVDLSLSQLSSATGITINGPSSAFVIFDISSTTPTNTTLTNVTFNLSGGVTSNDILYNLTNATQLTLNGGNYLSILAPDASITFTSGLLTGNLIAQNLYGSGQVNTGIFTGFQQDQSHFNVLAPEPTTYITLFTFLSIAILLFKKNRKLNLVRQSATNYAHSIQFNGRKKHISSIPTVMNRE